MEKRGAPRIPPFVASCRYVVGEARAAGILSDLSRSGARVHSGGDGPSPGAEVVVEVKLGRQATHVRIPGIVRWSRAAERGGSVFGLSFDGIGPAEQQIVDDVIEEFRRRAAQLA